MVSLPIFVHKNLFLACRQRMQLAHPTQETWRQQMDSPSRGCASGQRRQALSTDHHTEEADFGSRGGASHCEPLLRQQHTIGFFFLSDHGRRMPNYLLKRIYQKAWACAKRAPVCHGHNVLRFRLQCQRPPLANSFCTGTRAAGATSRNLKPKLSMLQDQWRKHSRLTRCVCGRLVVTWLLVHCRWSLL